MVVGSGLFCPGLHRIQCCQYFLRCAHPGCGGGSRTRSGLGFRLLGGLLGWRSLVRIQCAHDLEACLVRLAERCRGGAVVLSECRAMVVRVFFAVDAPCQGASGAGACGRRGARHHRGFCRITYNAAQHQRLSAGCAFFGRLLAVHRRCPYHLHDGGGLWGGAGPAEFQSAGGLAIDPVRGLSLGVGARLDRQSDRCEARHSHLHRGLSGRHALCVRARLSGRILCIGGRGRSRARRRAEPVTLDVWPLGASGEKR